jgi:hypothetical protein
MAIRPGPGSVYFGNATHERILRHWYEHAPVAHSPGA